MPYEEPRYERVMADLRKRIAANEFPDGKLPSTAALVTHYGYSRETIRQAITRMILLGELRGEQGAGVYVVPRDAE